MKGHAIAPFLLNSSFALNVQLLDELAQIRIYKAPYLLEMRGLVQEVQLEINTVLLNPLESVGLNDWARFDEVREAMEKTLRGKK